MMPGARRGRSSSRSGAKRGGAGLCVGGSPTQDPCPSLQSPCGRSLAGRSEARCSRAALAVRALRLGRALREDRCSDKFESAVISLGRALIWMFGFLSPRSPALWKGVLFRLARRRCGSSCLCSAVHPARPADPHGARVPPAQR